MRRSRDADRPASPPRSQIAIECEIMLCGPSEVPPHGLLLQTLPIEGAEPLAVQLHKVTMASGVQRSAEPYALSPHEGSGTFGVASPRPALKRHSRTRVPRCDYEKSASLQGGAAL